MVVVHVDFSSGLCAGFSLTLTVQVPVCVFMFCFKRHHHICSCFKLLSRNKWMLKSFSDLSSRGDERRGVWRIHNFYCKQDIEWLYTLWHISASYPHESWTNLTHHFQLCLQQLWCLQSDSNICSESSQAIKRYTQTTEELWKFTWSLLSSESADITVECIYVVCQTVYFNVWQHTNKLQYNWFNLQLEEAFRSFTAVKVLIPRCKNTLLQVKSCIENVTSVKVCKYNHKNVLKVLKALCPLWLL